MTRSLIYAAVVALMLSACGRDEAPKTTAPPPPAPSTATPPPATTPPAGSPSAGATKPTDPTKPEEKK